MIQYKNKTRLLQVSFCHPVIGIGRMVLFLDGKAVDDRNMAGDTLVFVASKPHKNWAIQAAN